jgi:hypothetical protein
MEGADAAAGDLPCASVEFRRIRANIAVQLFNQELGAFKRQRRRRSHHASDCLLTQAPPREPRLSISWSHLQGDYGCGVNGP